MVFSFDEKSRIQALDRTQPGLPMKKGRGATMTHDYKRQGTTTLFAALNIATGEVLGKTYRKHRHQEVLRFLREVERRVPKDQEIHIVLDNYATHKHEKVLGWIERNKHVFLHFTPTSALWVNLVKRFFAALTHKRICWESSPRCSTSRNVSENMWRATTKTPNRSSGRRASRSSPKRSTGHGRYRPTLFNQFFIKDIALGQSLTSC